MSRSIPNASREALDAADVAPSDIDDSGIRATRPSSPDADCVRLEVEVSLTSESQFFSGLSGDLFEGGIFVQTYRALHIGAMVEIEIALPERRVLGVGCVRWVRDVASGALPGLGVVLIGLSVTDREAIERFLRLRTPLYYEP